MSKFRRLLAELAAGGISNPGSGRYRLNGRDIVDPSGVPFRLFGMNEGHSVYDQGYYLPTDPALFLACNCNYVRFELHMGFGQTDPAYTYPGSVDLYDATAVDTGYMIPTRLARVLDMADAFSAVGILQGFAFHSKWLRINFATQPTYVAQLQAAQVYLCGLARVRNDPKKILIEHMNEPDPPGGVTQAQANAFYLGLIAAVRTVHPDIISIAGPLNGYATGQLANCYLSGIGNVGYAFDLFVQGGAPDQEANQVERIGEATSFVATFNAFAYADQWGGTTDAYPTGSYTTSMATKLIAAGMHCCYWEVTAPGTGTGTFHTVQVNDGTNPPTINSAQQALVASWGASFAALRGVSLN